MEKAETGKTHELEAIRLREQRRDLEKDIALGGSEKSRNKAPPPPAPKSEAHPTNILESPPKSPTRPVQLSKEDERICSSGEEEEEERGDIAPGPIDLTKSEQVAGAPDLMTLFIAELKDVQERTKYVEKQRSPQTFEIIGDPGGIGGTLQEMGNEPTQPTLYDLEMPSGSY